MCGQIVPLMLACTDPLYGTVNRDGEAWPLRRDDVQQSTALRVKRVKEDGQYWLMLMSNAQQPAIQTDIKLI